MKGCTLGYNPKNACVIGYTHAIDDKRVFRTVKLLSKFFDKVTYIYRSYNPDMENGFIKRSRLTNVEFVGVSKRGKGIFSRARFDVEVLRAAEKSDSTLWYVHDFLRTMPFELTRRTEKGIKVIYDVHEFVPEWVLKLFPSSSPVILRKAAEWLFLTIASAASHIVTVNLFTKEFLEKRIGKVATVAPNLADEVEGLSPKPVRGWETVIVGKTRRGYGDALNLITEMAKLLNRPVRMVVIGMGEDENRGSSFVEVLPFMPYRKMLERVGHSAFSIIIFRTVRRRYANDFASLPHKFFDSLYAGTPVLVDRYFTEMSHITASKRVGVVVDVRRPVESAKKVLNVLFNPKSYRVLVRNVLRLRESFSWKTHENRLRSIVEDLLKNHGNAI